MAIELRNINPAVFDYNVGIGTASPASPLHVYGTTNDGSSLTILTQLGTGRGQHIVRSVAAATRALVNIVQSHASGGAEAALDIQQSTTASHALRITSNGSTVTSSITGAGTGYFAGNVGIGTTSPTYPLQVRPPTGSYSNNLFRLDAFNSADHNFHIRSVDAGGSFNYVFETETSTVLQAALTLKASNGNVGIGTTSPARTLNVYNNTSYSGLSEQLRLEGGAAAGAGVGFYTGTSGAGRRNWLVGTEVSDLGDFGIINSTAAGGAPSAIRFLITNTGNVGIGTTSPTAPLSIQANGGGAGFNVFGPNGTMLFQAGGVNGAGLISQSNSSTQGFVIGTDGGGTSAGQYLRFLTSGVTRAVIDNSGNVGIGTTAPFSKLLVVGTSRGTALNVGPAPSTGNYVDIYGNAANAGTVHIGTNYWVTDGSLALGTYTTPDAMTLTTTGYVGIGTPSPTEKLHVSGNLKIEGLLKFQDGTSYPSAAASASRAMACPIDGARGVYDNDVLWLWDGTYRTVNESQYYIGRTESHATNGGSARVLDVLTTTGGGTFNDVSHYERTWNDNYMIGVATAASVGAPTTWVTATLPCDPSVHNVLHVKVISTDRRQIVGAYILNSAGTLQSKLQSHGNAGYDSSSGDISTVGPRNSSAKTTSSHEWVSIIIPKAHLTSHAYANANSPTGYSVKIALYNGDSRGDSLYISGLGISRNPTGFVHVNAIDLHWATNGGGGTDWYGGWNHDSINKINARTNYSDIRIPIAGTDRDILIGAVDHGDNGRGPGAIFWLNNYNQPSIPNATFYLSTQITGTYGKMNIGVKYRGFSGFVVPKALVQAYAQTYLGQQYLSFYIYNLRNDNNVHFRAMYSEQVNRIGNSKSITGAAFNMKNSNYKAADIVDVSTYDGY